MTSKRNSNNSEFVEKVASRNVRITGKQILKNSPILKEMIEDDQIALVCGMYDVETGIVDFYYFKQVVLRPLLLLYWR